MSVENNLQNSYPWFYRDLEDALEMGMDWSLREGKHLCFFKNMLVFGFDCH